MWHLVTKLIWQSKFTHMLKLFYCVNVLGPVYFFAMTLSNHIPVVFAI